jgi:hypothetical protein
MRRDLDDLQTRQMELKRKLKSLALAYRKVGRLLDSMPSASVCLGGRAKLSSTRAL